MCKRIGLLLLLVLFGATFASAQELPDLGGRTITVAVENAYLPFNYIDTETGEAVGWDYDAVREICARLNCVPEFVEVAWEGMLVAIANGEFDVAGDGITITPERDQVVDFSIGYINVDQILVARLDETRFSTVDEFVADSSLRLGTQVGTTNYATALDLVGSSRIQAFELFPFAIQALIAGDVDAVIIDSTSGQGYVGENAELIKSISGVITSDQLGFAFPNGSELKAAFDAALMSMMADGTLNAINTKWFPPVQPVLPDLAGRTITVAVENAYLPFNYIDTETGEAVGWDYDAVREICARLNCVPEFVEVAWEGMLVAIANGEFDVAGDGITITPERDQVVDFSIGYINVDQILVARLDETRFSTVDEFVADSSLRLGTQVGTTNYATALDLVGSSRIQAFELFPFAIQALIAGDVDAVIIDSTSGQGYVGENAELIKSISGVITSDQLGFAFPNGSELKAAFDAALMSMMADGTLNAINTKWFPPVE